MDERLFRPLGMTRTTFRPTAAMTLPLSRGHDAAGRAKPTVVRPFVNHVGDWPAGFAYSNVTDLARFAIAFMNGGRIGERPVLSTSAVAARHRVERAAGPLPLGRGKNGRVAQPLPPLESSLRKA